MNWTTEKVYFSKSFFRGCSVQEGCTVLFCASERLGSEMLMLHFFSNNNITATYIFERELGERLYFFYLCITDKKIYHIKLFYGINLSWNFLKPCFLKDKIVLDSKIIFYSIHFFRCTSYVDGTSWIFLSLSDLGFPPSLILILICCRVLWK